MHGNATETADVNVDTTDKKWGAASADFDGDSGDLTYADSADWDLVASSTDSWTIDFWVKHDDHAGTEYYIDQFEDANNAWRIYHDHGNGLYFNVRSGGVSIIDISDVGEIADTNWHHLALCKIADEYGLYKDGTQVGYTQDNSTDNFTGGLYLGERGTTAGGWYDGSIDELRIMKGNPFGAAPDNGLTDTITVPTAAYTQVLAQIMIVE